MTNIIETASAVAERKPKRDPIRDLLSVEQRRVMTEHLDAADESRRAEDLKNFAATLLCLAGHLEAWLSPEQIAQLAQCEVISDTPRWPNGFGLWLWTLPPGTTAGRSPAELHGWRDGHGRPAIRRTDRRNSEMIVT